MTRRLLAYRPEMELPEAPAMLPLQQEDELALAARLLELQVPLQFDAFLARQLGATAAGRQVRGTPLEGPLRQLLGKVVAHASRNCVGCQVLPPTRLYLRSWMARSNCACRGSGSSPTSSRNSTPPSARAKAPSRAPDAPVNAPRSWPNSSLPPSSGDRVVQSRMVKSPRQLPRRWTSCANKSLPVPVPVSPVISTEAWLQPL